MSLTLGGRENLHEVENKFLKKISINQVRGFNDISNLENYTELEELVLTDLAQLSRLDFPKTFDTFKELAIFNCKHISQINGIEYLSSIERITLDRVNIAFEEFMKTKFPKTLKILAFYTDKVRQDNEIYEHLKKLGYYQSIVELLENKEA